MDHALPSEKRPFPKDCWNAVKDALNTLLMKLPFHGPYLTSHYLHHFFSCRVHQSLPELTNLLDSAAPIYFHPDWPLQKKVSPAECGTCSNSDAHAGVEAGLYGEAVGFAFGAYAAPEIAVEIKLIARPQLGDLVSDYVKLLDGRNPFKLVVQAAIMMRPDGLPDAEEKDRVALGINLANDMARQSLDHELMRPKASRVHYFVLTELAPAARRHWCNVSPGGYFVEWPNLPPLI